MATATSADQKNDTKTMKVDQKARVTLPKDFANSTVDIEIVDEFEIRIRKVVVIPQREAWLYKNPAALGAVMTGLAEARAGELAEGPDPSADLAGLGPDED